jgi:hypothetical protein
MGPIIFVSLLHFSAAEALAPGPPSIGATFPDSTVVLPTNARLVAFGGAVDSSFLLQRGDGTVVALDVVASHPTTFSGQALVLPLPPLSVGEDIVLEPSCPSCGLTFPFRVGDADDLEAPAFSAGEASGTFTSGTGGNGVFGQDGFEIDACLPALVSNEPVLLQITGDDLAESLLTQRGSFCGDGEGVSVYFLVSGGDQREACFDITAVDVAGNAGAPFQLCLDLVDQDSGCAQTSATASTALALVLLGLRRRRQPGLVSAAPGR